VIFIAEDTYKTPAGTFKASCRALDANGKILWQKNPLPDGLVPTRRVSKTEFMEMYPKS